MVLQFKEPQDKTEQIQTAKKRKTAAKKVETLDEAFERLSQLKWDSAEWADILSVRAALEDGTLRRKSPEKKLSKKELLELADELREIRRQERIRRLVESAPSNYKVITDIKQFRQFISDLYEEPIVALDTETTGLDLFEDRIVGLSFWLPNADYGCYIPIYHGEAVSSGPGYGTIPHYKRWDGQLNPDLVLENLRDYLEDSSRKLILHNSKYDMHMLRNHGINVVDPYWDTQVCAFILNETEPHNLKKLAPKYLGVESDMFQELWGDEPTVYDKPIHAAGVYAVKDAHLTWKLYLFQKKHMERLDGLRYVFLNIEMPQIRISLEAERTGFGLDVEACKQLEKQFAEEVEKDVATLRQQLGIDDAMLQRMSQALGRPVTEFNINSPQQLQWLIYDELKLPDIARSVNPKLENRSTASAVLQKLAEIDERIQPLVDYRMRQKLLSTYVSKFPEMVASDNRLHYQLVQFGTDTGRYSSKQYGNKNQKKGINAQNIPAKNKIAMRVRTLLVP
jgi:DNA polymerase-1